MRLRACVRAISGAPVSAVGERGSRASCGAPASRSAGSAQESAVRRARRTEALEDDACLLDYVFAFRQRELVGTMWMDVEEAAAEAAMEVVVWREVRVVELRAGSLDRRQESRGDKLGERVVDGRARDLGNDVAGPAQHLVGTEVARLPVLEGGPNRETLRRHTETPLSQDAGDWFVLKTQQGGDNRKSRTRLI